MQITQLLENNLLIRLIEMPLIAKSALFLSDEAKAELMGKYPLVAGVVVAAGPGVQSDIWDPEAQTFRLYPMSCKVGDTVAFMMGAALKLEDDGYPNAEMAIVTDKRIVCHVEIDEGAAQEYATAMEERDRFKGGGPPPGPTVLQP